MSEIGKTDFKSAINLKIKFNPTLSQTHCKIIVLNEVNICEEKFPKKKKFLQDFLGVLCLKLAALPGLMKLILKVQLL